MVIGYKSQNGTFISFEAGHGRFNIIRDGQDTRIGHIDAFSSITHFYKYLVDNYPDIADAVYIGIQGIKPADREKELAWVRDDLSKIKENEAGYND